MIPGDGNRDYNVITEYGRLTLEQIRAHVTSYVVPPQGQQLQDHQHRQRQNDYQAYSFLSSTADLEGHLKLLAETDKYVVNGHYSGVLYLKLMTLKAIVDTRATASHMRENLTNLDTYMISTARSNIKEFNQYVKVNREGLRARGQTTDDLMVNLFKGYLKVEDRDFVQYMKMKKSFYDDGNDLTVDELMQLALN